MGHARGLEHIVTLLEQKLCCTAAIVRYLWGHLYGSMSRRPTVARWCLVVRVGVHLAPFVVGLITLWYTAR